MRSAQEDQKQRRAKEESLKGFEGFGKGGADDAEAWAQWFAHVRWVNEGSPEIDDDG